MTSLKEVLDCPRCGCLVLPDAIKCPKCGAFYDDESDQNKVGPLDYAAKPRVENVDIEVLTTRYQFNCARHGKVNVKSTVVASKIKCPFC